MLRAHVCVYVWVCVGEFPMLCWLCRIPGIGVGVCFWECVIARVVEHACTTSDIVQRPGTCDDFHVRTVAVFCETNAGRTTKFALVKSLRFSELFLGILLSEFRFNVFFGVES